MAGQAALDPVRGRHPPVRRPHRPPSASAGWPGRTAPGRALRRPDRGPPPPAATPPTPPAPRRRRTRRRGGGVRPRPWSGRRRWRDRRTGATRRRRSSRRRAWWSDRGRRSTDGGRRGPGSGPVRARRGAGTTRPGPAPTPATVRARPQASAPAARCPRTSPRPASARSVSDRTGSPSATSSSVRPSHDCWMPACATTPSCHRDWSWSPSSAAPRSRISSQPRSASTAITSGTSSGIASARACVAAASCRKMSALHLRKASPSVDEQRRTTDRPQSWCGRGAPTTGRPSAAIRSTIQVEARCEPPRGGPRRPQRRPALGTLAGPRGHGRPGRARLQPGDHLRVQVLPGPPGRRLGRGGLELQQQGDLGVLATFGVLDVARVHGRGHDQPQGRRPRGVDHVDGGQDVGQARLRAAHPQRRQRRRRGGPGGPGRRRRPGRRCVPDEGPAGSPDSSPPAQDRSCPEPSTDPPATPAPVAPASTGHRRDTPVRTRHAV